VNWTWEIRAEPENVASWELWLKLPDFLILLEKLTIHSHWNLWAWATSPSQPLFF
jgi:hypothetical protein